jgi:hypothetical protein
MQAVARRAAAPVFALALFSSAALIFVLQPLFGRMVTPMLGGSPQVWNASMAFFQGALLVGYLYAHLLQRVKDLKTQAIIHGVVLIAAWFVLPIHVSGALGQPSSEHPALWLVGVLTLSVGAPFAAASATAPLLQAWYARTGRADAHDPYYLYAASNLGSFIGLLAYPALIEPLMGAQAQSGAWSVGYVAVVALIVLSAATAVSANGEAPKPSAQTGAAPTWRERGYWMAAAAVPSAMSLGATLHISTDVASAPMLWVVPLALYLGTFVLAFMKGNERLDAATLFIHPIALALMIASYFSGGNWVLSVSLILSGFFFSALVCHLALSRSRPSADRLTEFYLFVSLGGVLGGAFAAFAAPLIFNNVYEFPLAMAAACLFRPREASDMPRLTDASLAAAAALGVLALLLTRIAPLDGIVIFAALGAAAGMIAAGWGDEERPAPIRYGFLGLAAAHAALVIWIAFNMRNMFISGVVDGEREFAMREPWSMLLLVSSFLMLVFAVHGTVQRRRDDKRLADYAYGAMIPSLVLAIMLVLTGELMENYEKLVVVGLLFCGIALFFNRGRPVVLAGVVLVAFAMIFLADARGGRIITQERTFFGVLRTRVYATVDASVPPVRVLLHGTTLHGAQIAAPGFSRQPLTYYHPRTALGEAIVAGLGMHEPSRLALIGLGTGSTACLMRPGDELTIYEIDPEVVRLSAEPGGDFTFVPECQPHARIVLGDARLRIADAPDGAYDVIVVDAFSSDAIPAHLLTREAIALYISKTSEHGIVVLHLSNRNLALVSEAARVARDLGLPTLYRISNPFDLEPRTIYGASAASVMIVARSPATLEALPLANPWVEYAAPPGRGWSDDYINLPRALWDQLSGAEECRLYPQLPRCGGPDEAPPSAAVSAPTVN